MSLFKLEESCISKNQGILLLEFFKSIPISSPVVLIGMNDAFMSTGNRASFLSHIDEEDDDEDEIFSQVLSAIKSHPSTIVCAIDGHVGGGLEFLMACDYRVSNNWVEFSVDSSNQENIPENNSMDKFLSGQILSALEAHSISLIDEIVNSTEELISVSLKLAQWERPRRSERPASCLLHYLPDEYLKFRVGQVFNLIRDFPESHFAIDELREAITLTRQEEYVIDIIRKQIEDRLLIPGAHTEDVLQMYLRTYQVVEVLFTHCEIVFPKIAQSIIAHLHKRSDAVKCIVSAILEHSEDDTILLLIGVYGGKDDFLKEYKEMLASRLLALGSFEIDRESASLDLMRSKFGQPELLTDCSIMVKDLIESRKFQIQTHFFSSLVLTKHSWPVSQNWEDDNVSFLPESVLEEMKNFELNFTRLKPTQKLHWIKSQGVVTIELEKDNGIKMTFTVTPIHLHVLSIFGDSVLSIEEISAKISENMETTKSVVQFWSSKNILREIQINQFIITS